MLSAQRKVELRVKKTRMWVYAQAVVCSLLVFIMGLGVFFVRMNEGLRNFAMEHILMQTQQECTSIESLLNTQFSILRSLSLWLTEHPDVEEQRIHDLMYATVTATDFFRMAIVTPNGDACYGEGLDENVADTEYFKEAMRGEESLTTLDLGGEHERLVLALPVYNKAGEIQCVIAGSYELSNLFDTLRTEKGVYFIADSEGNFIVTESRWQQLRGANIFSYFTDVDFVSNGSMETIREDFARRNQAAAMAELDDMLAYMAYAPLPCSSWMMCYVVSEANVRAEYGFIQQASVVAFLTALLVLLAVLVVLLFFMRRDYKRIEWRSRTDLLTGLYNKVSTQQEIERLLEEGNEDNKGALILFDMDDFKSINDTCGHAAGDAVLRQMADFLKAHFRNTDVIGRLGGDEFAVFLPGAEPSEHTRDWLTAVVTLYNTMAPPKGSKRAAKCSAGVAFAPQDGKKFSALYHKADQALYCAKNSGKNCLAIYCDKTQEEQTRQDCRIVGNEGILL
jgi:diguanylate cyclase (GGDEF)-like protein